ncbi:guanine nucleotide exchange factor [Anaeramoeba flamelloides]|uniref:Guanine nucleotide exchange factor n=1 Tax=Anaeramoeba flamelloides TaxID=1746091 RepID=A0ABQ8YRJ2_9EUKA|nr:guanine nucleotide exchange factor [Anaeramoeba flamelloides]
MAHLEIGKQLVVDAQKATILFLGTTDFDEGNWVGLELSKPKGNNNGTIGGVEYFKCKPNHGLFLRSEYLKLNKSKIKSKTKTKANSINVRDSLRNMGNFSDLSLQRTVYLHSKSLDFLVQDQKQLTKEIASLETKLRENGIHNSVIQGIEEEQQLEKIIQQLELVNNEIQQTDQQIEYFESGLEIIQKDTKKMAIKPKIDRVNKVNKKLEKSEQSLSNEKQKMKLLKERNDSLQIDLKFAKSTGERQIQKLNQKIAKREKLITYLELQRKNLIKQLSSPSTIGANSENLKKEIKFLEKELEQTKKELAFTEKKIEQTKPLPPLVAFSKNKPKWIPILMRRNPKILQMRERLNVFTKKLSFSRFYQTSKSEKSELINSNFILSLIIQHYTKEGKKTLVDFLKKKFSITVPESLIKNENKIESDLYSLVRLVLKTNDILFRKSFRRESDKGIHGEQEEMETLRLYSNDISIWDEPPDSKNNIVFDEKERKKLGSNSARNILETVVSANINKLIERLTWWQASDSEFIRVFLTTHRSFMTSEYLLLKLFQRYQVPEKREGIEKMEWDKRKKLIQLRVFSVLRTWLLEYFGQFTETMIRMIENFSVQIMMQSHPSHPKQLQKIIQKKKQNSSQKSKNITQFSEPAPKPRVPKNLFSKNLHLSQIDELEFARQLTLYIHKLFLKIDSTELLVAGISSKISVEHSPNFFKLKNIFNQQISFFVWEILKHEKPRDRVKEITRIIKIGEHLYNFCNLESLFALVAALQHKSIQELDVIMGEVPKNSLKLFTRLKKIANPDSNYASSRKFLKKVASASIPYHGMYVDLMREFNKGSQNDAGGRINLTKRRLLFNVIEEVKSYHASKYNFQKVKQIQLLFDKLEEPIKNQEFLLRSNSLQMRPEKQSHQD